jgi:diguanylate cyclase (GGDEF)-like protein/PAS domain S-box-containing protein
VRPWAVGQRETQEYVKMPMHIKIGERFQAAALGAGLLSTEADFRTLTEAIAGPIFISQGSRLHYVNHAAEIITGYTREQLLFMNFCDLLHSDSRKLFLDLEPAQQGRTAQHEVRIVAKSGEARWLEIRIAKIEFDGVLSSLVSAFDVTERKEAEEQLQLLAITDPLTGLGNYRRLVQALDAEVKRSERTGRPFAVLLVDLNRLKRINDRYGHLVGSQVLCRFADVLRVDCRAIDTTTRYGGDEFAIILPETTASDARLAASRIRDRLAADSRQPAFSVSIGVAVYPQSGKTMEALLRMADRALYGMKSQQEKCAPLQFAAAANSCRHSS